MFGAREGPVVTENRTKKNPCSRLQREGVCILIVPIPIAPHFHSTSSCLWQQLGVLLWWCSLGRPALVVIVVMPSCHPHPHCIPFPPHEQLVMAVVGGAVLVVVLRHHLSLLLSLSSSLSLSLSLSLLLLLLLCVAIPPLATLIRHCSPHYFICPHLPLPSPNPLLSLLAPFHP